MEDFIRANLAQKKPPISVNSEESGCVDGDDNLYAEIEGGDYYDSLDFNRPNRRHVSHYFRSNSVLDEMARKAATMEERPAFREVPGDWNRQL